VKVCWSNSFRHRPRSSPLWADRCARDVPRRSTCRDRRAPRPRGPCR
jgi:hypothetical protein